MDTPDAPRHHEDVTEPLPAAEDPTPTQRFPSYAPTPPPLPPLPPTVHHHVRPSYFQRHRGVAAGAATAILFGAGGLGVGLLVGPHHESSTPSAAGGQTQTQTPGQGYGGSNPFSGEGSLPGGGIGGNGFGSQDPTQTTGEVTRSATAQELVGLVRIQTSIDFGEGAAAGTGMILTSDGEVVTNHHVVEDATSIKVTVMSTGRTYTATVIGTDAKSDVAVLQLRGASGLSTVATDTGSVATNDAVTAVGDADGTSTFTAAPGTVTGLNRSITTEAEDNVPAEHLTGMIQITADVISGDSGGATYRNGKVVGMTAAASTGGGSVDGYVIPISTVLSIASDIENHVSSSAYSYGYPAFLGIGLDDSTGTTVQEVYAGSAAAGAGIVRGDAITRVGTTPVSTAAGLEKAMKAYSPGERATVTWTTAAGATRSATVTLGTGPVA